jgi:hypothetical protein
MPKPGSVIVLKHDRRYKLGNIKREGDVLRGHPETLQMKPLYDQNIALSLNPPYVVGKEMAEAIKKTFD